MDSRHDVAELDQAPDGAEVKTSALDSLNQDGALTQTRAINAYAPPAADNQNDAKMKKPAAQQTAKSNFKPGTL